MVLTEETEIEDDLEDEEEPIPFIYPITSYGADYPVASLVGRIRDGSIYVPPFRRRYIWKIAKASRFVESLLLGLPVPGIFLSTEQETGKLVVIDGQQRLRTLQYFYEGTIEPSGKQFALEGVPSQFAGFTYRSLRDEDRRRLDDSILHATIVRQDVPSDDDSSIYHIFERLNTGSVPLRPQEIRTTMYHGEFNDLLWQLNGNKAWRSVFGNIHDRMKDQELILRFLALYSNSEEYRSPMKQFLNMYMGKNRHLRSKSAEELRKVFTNTIELVVESLGEKAFKPKKAFNSPVFDAVMVGIARRLEKGEVHDPEELSKQYQALLENEEFTTIVFEDGTMSEERVRLRLKLATEAFADLK